MPDYEEVEHSADLALHMRGRDLAELLVNAALGLGSLLQTADDPATGAEVSSTVLPSPVDQERHIQLEAHDTEGLLVEWLSELLYLAETERFVGRAFAVHSVSPTHLEAVARGGPVGKLRRHIKAVTYHQLEIIAAAHGLETTVVFDV